MKIPAESAPEAGTLARSPGPAARSALGSPPWPRSFPPRRRGGVWGSGSAPGVVRRARPAQRQPSKSSRRRGGRGAGSGRVRSRDWAARARRRSPGGLRGVVGAGEPLSEQRLPRAAGGGRARRAASPGRCCDGPARKQQAPAAALGGLARGAQVGWGSGRPARRGRGGRGGEAGA